MTKVKEAEPVPTVPDIFLETLRKSLEHIADPVWLEKNSPFTSVFFANQGTGGRSTHQLQLTERADVDRQLRSIWRDWEDLSKTPLQALIWETIGQLAGEIDDLTQSILLLSYFDLAQPKQSQVIKILAVGRSTYYRYLERAVEKLGFEVVKNLRPSLRLEQPQPRQLVGRENEFQLALSQLQNGRAVHLVGGSGLGKTSLGARLAASWELPVFWYTFRPQLTDSLEQLLFALAFFLHQQGASGLWLYLSSLTEPIQPDRAIMALSQHLDELRSTPPLFCFDEADLLLPDDLNDSESHVQLRGFLSEWAKMDRSGSPLLFIGQKLLLEPEQDNLIILSQLHETDLIDFMHNLHVDVESSDIKKLYKLTKGNPLLLRLVAILFQQGTSISDSLEQLTSSVTLDWFWQNLRQRLIEAELVILREISVFQGNAPRDGWRRHSKLIDQMISRGILEETSIQAIGLHPALRRLIYDQIPQVLKTELHLGAAHILAERSHFTLAAYHFIEAGRPEMAIWTWYSHRQTEIDQGQARIALALFETLDSLELADRADQKALALLIAQLSSLSGSFSAGLKALEEIEWQNETASSVTAHEYRGVLLSQTGEAVKSIDEYRKSLDVVENLRVTQEIYLRTHIARRTYGLLRNIEQATLEANLAKFDLDILQGQLADASGDYNNARIHYANALAAADQITNPSRMAKLHEALGVMEARYAHVEAAVDHFKKAGQYHHECGNVVYARGLTNTNISYTYLAKRRYADALEPGEKALAFYQEINHPYWLAINEANLAEITFYLGRHSESRHYAESGLRREEPSVRPYCLYVLGHLSRVEQAFEQAEQLCQDAIESAQEIEDPWAEAPANNALGEVCRDAGRPEEALTTFNAALAIWKRIGVQHEVEYTEQLINSVSS